MQKQMVVDLQAELQKTKKEVQLAKEAIEAKKKAFYQLGVEEIEIRLAEELSEVCRDYCDATWDKALIAVGVPANFALKLPGGYLLSSSDPGDSPNPLSSCPYPQAF